MPSAIEEDWSDSDDGIQSDVETSVNLGLPDGALQEESDLYDAAVSRIGGRPAFLQSVEPPLSCSQCENCSCFMELLLQIYCPFEDSPMDRALYVWGCSKSGCQGVSGSVRAWRGMRYNEEYAKKLENKLARKRERQAKAKATSERSEGYTANPFSVITRPDTATPFTFGSQIFGDPPAQEEELQGRPEDESDDESISSEESLVTAMATTTLNESPWMSAPSYPAIYLSTSPEYIPAESTPKLVPKMSDGNEKDDVGKWVSEAYENSLDMDQVFDRFSKRVGYDGEQCVRYELNGVPLPFASDSVLEKLFPSPPEEPLPVTKGAFKVVLNRKRVYAPVITECPDCKGKRVFECQLMPNLINVLRSKENKKMTEEERRKHVQLVLKGGGEFGKEGWKEELVLVQWDK